MSSGSCGAGGATGIVSLALAKAPGPRGDATGVVSPILESESAPFSLLVMYPVAGVFEVRLSSSWVLGEGELGADIVCVRGLGGVMYVAVKSVFIGRAAVMYSAEGDSST